MSDSFKKPVKDRVAKVPIVIQMEALECGAACLDMALAYYQKWIPLSQVRHDCGVSRDGSTLKNIYLAATRYGLQPDAYRMETSDLLKRATFPCIIHWDFNHFVVLDGFKNNKAVINDSARGVVRIPMEDFDRSFTGPCLLLEPGPDFRPSGKRRSTLDYAKARLKGAGFAVLFVVLTTIIAYLFQAINPVMSRIFFDRILNGRAPSWIQPFFIALIILCVCQVCVEWIRTIYSMKIDGKMAIEGNASFMWKILHLPMDFFSQRMSGDIMQRQQAERGIFGHERQIRNDPQTHQYSFQLRGALHGRHADNAEPVLTWYDRHFPGNPECLYGPGGKAYRIGSDHSGNAQHDGTC